MNTLLLMLSWLLPLLLVFPALGAGGRFVPALAALPALAAVFLLPSDAALSLPYLLLGASLGLDETGRIFLLGSALLWCSAALYAADALRHDARAPRFRLFFLLAMAGNFLLILAQDALTFYAGFALMGLAAYGLVGHRRSQRVRRAAGSYLIWTLVGELILFSALVAIAAETDDLAFAQIATTELSALPLVLLLLGFGIKLALPGLHLWLPLAYPAAPAAGAAVLSGAMINAGLLGWLRFLPLGQPSYAAWGETLVAIGLFAAFFGVAVGLVQTRPRVVLGYSSISQMGLMTSMVGIALSTPSSLALLLTAVSLYALHHGLAKGALFLAVDAHQRSRPAGWTFALLVVLALVLAGAPLTSGALAKALYKSALPADGSWIITVLALSSVATTLLMARFLRLARAQRPAGAPLAIYARLAVFLLVLTGFVAIKHGPDPDLAAMAAGAWPVLLGGALAAALLVRPVGALHALIGALPPGDLAALLSARLRRLAGRLSWPAVPRFSLERLSVPSWADRYEQGFRRWPISGLAWTATLLVLVISLSMQ